MRNIELRGGGKLVAMDFAVDLTIEAIKADERAGCLGSPEVTTKYLEAVYDKVVELISKEI